MSVLGWLVVVVVAALGGCGVTGGFCTEATTGEHSEATACGGGRAAGGLSVSSPRRDDVSRRG